MAVPKFSKPTDGHQVNLHGFFWRSDVLIGVLQGRAGEFAINL